MEIHLSNYFNIEKGHKNLDFADINLERDTKLFIDPYLIKFGSSDICKEMAEVVQSFENELFESFRAKIFLVRKSCLLILRNVMKQSSVMVMAEMEEVIQLVECKKHLCQ